MGSLPLQLKAVNLTDLKLNGSETFDIHLEQITSKINYLLTIKINQERLMFYPELIPKKK